MIATGSSNHTRPRNIGRKDSVERTTRLERARVLKKLQLKEDLRINAERGLFELNYRGATNAAVNPRSRSLNVLAGNNIHLRPPLDKRLAQAR